MPLNQQGATQIAQLLGQFYDVFRLVYQAGETPNLTAQQIFAQLQIQNPLGGAVFGFTALSFVYTYDAVVKEEGFPAPLVGVVNLAPLNITRNNCAAGETVERACLRHLRNCFAHGRYRIHVVNNNQDVEVTLHDENPQGVPTFEARCAAAKLADLAERLLIACRNHAASIALPPAAAGAGAAAGAPQPAPAAVKGEGRSSGTGS